MSAHDSTRAESPSSARKAGPRAAARRRARTAAEIRSLRNRRGNRRRSASRVHQVRRVDAARKGERGARVFREKFFKSSDGGRRQKAHRNTSARTRRPADMDAFVARKVHSEKTRRAPRKAASAAAARPCGRVPEPRASRAIRAKAVFSINAGADSKSTVYFNMRARKIPARRPYKSSPPRAGEPASIYRSFAYHAATYPSCARSVAPTSAPDSVRCIICPRP